MNVQTEEEVILFVSYLQERARVILKNKPASKLYVRFRKIITRTNILTGKDEITRGKVLTNYFVIEFENVGLNGRRKLYTFYDKKDHSNSERYEINFFGKEYPTVEKLLKMVYEDVESIIQEFQSNIRR